jgi:acetylornithine deacetylase/succinyl-diaminopimelate desuccinylase-like protein
MPDALERLLAIRSTADRPENLRRALDLVLGELGPKFTVERFERGGKPSALVYAGEERPRFRVLFNGHLDVVPGSDDQFRPRQAGHFLYARGAHDMKAAALVLAEVFRATARDLPFPLGLQLVTDEEVGGFDGTGFQVEQGVEADFVVIGEQSGLRVVAESKGIAQVRLLATGVAAHAAYPWMGRNALVALQAGLTAVLARHPTPAAEAWRTTVNLARVETGNRAVNQVPAVHAGRPRLRRPLEGGDRGLLPRPHRPRHGGRQPRRAARRRPVLTRHRPAPRVGGRGGVRERPAAQARRRRRPVLRRARHRRGHLRPGRRRPARPGRAPRPAHRRALPAGADRLPGPAEVIR